jgi:dynactin complex subunit
LVAKNAKVEKAIKKFQALQLKYNELNQAHFKTRINFKAFQTNHG